MPPRRVAQVGLVASILAVFAGTAHAEDAICLAPEELGLWPAPSLPYMLVLVDSSAGLAAPVGTAPSCAGYPDDRLGHLRCALSSTFASLDGDARFGLATAARALTDCTSCFGSCSVGPLPSDAGPLAGCGAEPLPAPSSPSRAGANLVVPIAPDDFWAASPQPSNLDALAAWVDDACDDGSELFASGPSGANGLLRDASRYLQSGWTAPGGGPTAASPLGRAVDGERPCRQLSVVLVLGEDEGCDDPTDAVDAAAALRAGFEKDGLTWSVRTSVLTFEGVDLATADAIAAAGGTGEATVVVDDTDVEAALAAIVSAQLPPEVCDNLDNDCNGCTDEGSFHHCNTNDLCCANDTPEARGACLDAYEASVLTDPPDGDRSLLPCTDAAAKWARSSWLCTDPGDDVCDGDDDNCNGRVDDEVGTACVPERGSCSDAVQVCEGGELRCLGASPELCNGEDDDCDGRTDEGSCPDTEACVDYLGSLLCGAPCEEGGEFPCPPGQICGAAVDSETGALTSACVEGDGGCEEDADCASVTVFDQNSDPVCGATLSEDFPCHGSFPACICVGGGQCGPPSCQDADGKPTECEAPDVCALFGPRAGRCTLPDCFHTGCLACDEVCNDAAKCVQNPCEEGSCIFPDRAVCKPSEGFLLAECVGSCAGVRCPDGEVCARGDPAFVTGDPDCTPAPCGDGCEANETCDPSTDTCVPDLCVGVDCGPPGCCDPVTGSCRACPCEGVVCPAGEVCDPPSGDCVGSRPLGQPCEADRECRSAFCVDGVCCDGACDGGCLACSVALKGAGANGKCEPVGPGLSDPRQTCTTQAAETCGQTGVCDGDGACATHPVGTACAQNLACDEQGDCAKRKCTSNLDCGAGDVCADTGDCIPKPVAVVGCTTSAGGRGRAWPGGLAALSLALGALARRRPSQGRREA